MLDTDIKNLRDAYKLHRTLSIRLLEKISEIQNNNGEHPRDVSWDRFFKNRKTIREIKNIREVLLSAEQAIRVGKKYCSDYQCAEEEIVSRETNRIIDWLCEKDRNENMLLERLLREFVDLYQSYATPKDDDVWRYINKMKKSK